MSNFDINDGVVSIQLGQETIELEATPGAALNLSRLYGGLTAIMSKLHAMDAEAYINVVRYGANVSASEVEDLQLKVFSAGFIDLMQPCIQFISMLQNGGKLPGKVEKAENKPKKTMKKVSR
ncbi:MAG: hypothetical protein CMM93_01610 [Rickettsiales bacterium]|nr:hypothetical protein [Rickettsiales bacterium]|tara:strand:+ start:3473 stop:3838 length:366 start_codon:yes stop_codon:yes gene_type:complete